MFVSGGTDIPGDGIAHRLIAPTAVSAGHRITNVTIQLPSDATGFIAVGDENTVASPPASATGIQLYPGASESFSVSDLSDVWVTSDTDERVLWHAKAV